MEGSLRVRPEAEIFYRIDDCTDPWRKPPALLFVHGFGESGLAWYEWVPHFVRQYRVIRIDKRGFGRSTPMPTDFPWTLDGLAHDIEQVIEQLSPQGVHLVAAKIGGPDAVRIAALRPDLIKSLTLIGAAVVGPNHDATAEIAARGALREWIAETMRARMGPEMGAAALAWWVDLMSATPASTVIGFMPFVKTLDVTGDLGRLACPVLVIASDSARRPIAETEAWQRRIPRSALLRVPGDSYHAAVSHADFCAGAVARFLGEVAG